MHIEKCTKHWGMNESYARNTDSRFEMWWAKESRLSVPKASNLLPPLHHKKGNNIMSLKILVAKFLIPVLGSLAWNLCVAFII